MNPTRNWTLVLAAFVIALAPMAMANEHAAPEKKAELKVGDAAPDFKLPHGDKEGAVKKLSEYKGKKNVVLAFYPKAFTGGCTKQLCGYRDDFSKFKTADTEVVAISVDEQDYSDKFKLEHAFPFAVLGDIEASVVNMYGVGQARGNGAVMASRSIFLVDKAGKLAYIDPEYKIGQDEEPLFAAVKKTNEAGSGTKAQGSAKK